MGQSCSCDCGDKRGEMDYQEFSKNMESNARLSS